MAIHYSINLEGDLLLVEAWGFDENLEEVQAYGQAIIQACLEGGCTRVLCDELRLEYRLNTFDIFQSAESIAARVREPVKTAIVCNEKFITDAQFWETVAVNRGMTVRFFNDLDAARRWLGEGKEGGVPDIKNPPP